MTIVKIENTAWELIKECEVNSLKPLLRQLEDQGVEIPNACRTGMCGACLCFAPEGDDNLNKSLRGEPAFPLGEWEIMTCIWGVVDTDKIVVLRTMD